MIFKQPRGLHFLVLVSALLLGAGGCGEKEKRIADPGDGSLPFPSTPDQLMANFQAVYEIMDYEALQDMLAPGFETHLQVETTLEFPYVGTTLDLEEELRIHERMFGGEDFIDTNGMLIPAVESLDVLGFMAESGWTISPGNDLIPATEWALFNVDFIWSRGENYHLLRIRGPVKFYVTSRDSLLEGVMKPYYQMVGQVDLTNNLKTSEELNWGMVKALWW